MKCWKVSGGWNTATYTDNAFQRMKAAKVTSLCLHGTVTNACFSCFGVEYVSSFVSSLIFPGLFTWGGKVSSTPTYCNGCQFNKSSNFTIGFDKLNPANLLSSSCKVAEMRMLWSSFLLTAFSFICRMIAKTSLSNPMSKSLVDC